MLKPKKGHWGQNMINTTIPSGSVTIHNVSYLNLLSPWGHQLQSLINKIYICKKTLFNKCPVKKQMVIDCVPEVK